MKVNDFMDTAPPVLRLTDTVGYAATLMLQSGVRTLPVVDEQEKLLGLVRDINLLHILIPEYLESLEDLSFLPPDLEPKACGFAEASQALVSHVMRPSPQLPTVEEDEPLLEAIRLMAAECLTVVPVVREGKLVGIIQSTRLLQALKEASEKAGECL